MLLCLGLLCLAIGGCGHPRIGAEAFELAKAVDNVCNLRDRDQLPKAQALVETAHRDGTINAGERRILEKIVAQAESGDWERASDDVRKLLIAQQR
ncbi:MAG: hypothetical protein KJ000_15045 [Pirellulaceae bacterium]|nr:hypothetical protein [Pirellulaceae bacterium]